VTQQQSASAALTVSAGAGLKKAMEELKPIYRQSQPNVTITYNFASSGSLQQQIEQGAVVDIFISAAAKQMDALQTKGLLLTDTRKNLLSDRVVLIAPKNSTAISSFQDLTSDRVKKIALGEPKSVPLGKYAEEILTSFKILASVKPKAVYARDGMQILNYVETGNTDAGIAHESSAKQSTQVKIVAVAPEKSHSPPVYPVAVLKNSKNATQAKAFVQFLFSDEAKAVFAKYGYKMAS
jgi:molybdate transport system substrate-binding protein